MQSSSKNNIVMSHNSEIACCSAVDPATGDICGEQTGLQILNEFREFYEERIRRVDINSDNGVEEKMKIMMEWIKDLDAQNTMLVCTVEELEEAACGRVKMLEEKLKHTSSALTDNMPQYIKPSETILNDVHKRINQLEAEEEMLKLKVVNLQSDIRGLLELIRRANMENCWRLDGIKFYEINQRDIPIPDESSYGQVNRTPDTPKKLRVIIELDGSMASLYPSSIALCDCASDSDFPNYSNNNCRIMHET
ncbi:hypothetical protein PV325_012877 [Microctonus aethiopoides]|nr:hypothetical protein PV325_012877 [Microctonus aethiopoides]